MADGGERKPKASKCGPCSRNEAEEGVVPKQKDLSSNVIQPK
jgi:hypothetical protein